MPQFDVDEELAAMVWLMAKPKPFETLSFNAALWRVLLPKKGAAEPDMSELDELLRDSLALQAARGVIKKAPTPSVTEWIASVPELKTKKVLGTWKAVCDHLKIDTGGDSARRKLKNWVKANRPTWPPVPTIE
jgi:hypothetical protein